MHCISLYTRQYLLLVIMFFNHFKYLTFNSKYYYAINLIYFPDFVIQLYIKALSLQLCVQLLHCFYCWILQKHFIACIIFLIYLSISQLWKPSCIKLYAIINNGMMNISLSVLVFIYTSERFFQDLYPRDKAPIHFVYAL